MQKKIVFIDNNDFYRRFYKRKLEEKTDFITADNGKEGFEKIEEEKPDLVITEITLPLKGGFKIIEEMRKNPDLKDIPVVVLTDLNQESDREEGEKYGVSAYFVKSEDGSSEIVKKIYDILNLNFDQSI